MAKLWMRGRLDSLGGIVRDSLSDVAATHIRVTLTCATRNSIRGSLNLEPFLKISIGHCSYHNVTS